MSSPERAPKLKPAFRLALFFSILASFVAVPFPVPAGTNYHSSFIGFSADGKYLALEVSGVVDGLGREVCSVDIYDLERDKVIPGSEQRATPGEGISCETARAESLEQLKHYGISKKHQGADAGLQTVASPGAGETSRTTRMEFKHRGKTCFLALYEAMDQGDNPWGRTMVTWNIGLSCGSDPEQKLFYEDRTNFSVKIEDALIMQDRLVLFTRTSDPDFEGPGSSPGVVSAVLYRGPQEGAKLSMEVIGFSEDNKLFGYWLSGVDKNTYKPEASLRVVAVPSGQETFSKTIIGEQHSDPKSLLSRLKDQMKGKLAELKFGSDPGTELYKSGTASSTAFKVDKKTYKLELAVVTQPGETDDIVNVNFTRPGSGLVSLQTYTRGYNRSLNSIRLSNNKKAIAVITKFSVVMSWREDRTYSVVFAILGEASATVIPRGTPGLQLPSP